MNSPHVQLTKPEPANIRRPADARPARAFASRGALLRRARRAAPAAAVGGLAAVTAISAYRNYRRAREAEHRNPPLGRFIEVDGVQLHYLDRGRGRPLVLLHGNGSMIQDFLSSGLLDRASETCRVIAFDRPGYGYSTRPRDRVWTPEAQANIIAEALRKLGSEQATVLGHSWGCLVAVALGCRHPDLVDRLVLESGYYYPSVRVDVVPMAMPAVPVIGDVIRYAIAPNVSRLLWPRILRKIFGPAPVPEKFRGGFPREMALRPWQLRASAAESGLMIPWALAAQEHYRELIMPVSIIVGDEDRLIDPDAQSAKLHRELPHSTFTRVPGAGHMLHQTAMPSVLDEVRGGAAGAA